MAAMLNYDIGKLMLKKYLKRDLIFNKQSNVSYHN